MARLALDVDEVAQQILAEPLAESDELLLAAPTAHLASALEWLEQALYETDRLDQRPQRARRRAGQRKEPISMPTTPKVTEIPGLALPASPQERERLFWRLSSAERVALMRAGELTLKECCRWAARAPHEVPLSNGEFEFITASTPEACER
ncbi:MAG: hypothetical protein ACR2LV_02560 [Solirubrobacteraceae bacterium]